LTWIKPSLLWMMYRCGWGSKEGQETVLAVEITRDGFEWALRHACLSSYTHGVHPDRATWQRQLKRAPTRVQWDPERDLHLRPMPYRSLQLGLSGEAARRDADEWDRLHTRRDPARPRDPCSRKRRRPGLRHQAASPGAPLPRCDEILALLHG
jgi:hypothetical protein